MLLIRLWFHHADLGPNRSEPTNDFLLLFLLFLSQLWIRSPLLRLAAVIWCQKSWTETVSSHAISNLHFLSGILKHAVVSLLKTHTLN